MSDLISRQAVIDMLAEMQGLCTSKAALIQNSKIWQQIKDFPSAQPKGKWNGYNADDPDWQRDDGSPVFLSCSECHGMVINNGSAHWNFCPNCGADIRGEE